VPQYVTWIPLSYGVGIDCAMECELWPAINYFASQFVTIFVESKDWIGEK
jgi:hypothetical protein